MADLEVLAERQGSRAVLTLVGELDLANVELLLDAAEQQLRAGDLSELVLDLERVTFLDSSGLGGLLLVRGEAIAAGGEVTISGVARGAARIIAIAGLSDTFGLSAAP